MPKLARAPGLAGLSMGWQFFMNNLHEIHCILTGEHKCKAHFIDMEVKKNSLSFRF